MSEITDNGDGTFDLAAGTMRLPEMSQEEALDFIKRSAHECKIREAYLKWYEHQTNGEKT